MAGSLRYAETAIGQIKAYLSNVPGDVLGVTAALELRREFHKLAANPGLGTARIGGPFETRRVYRFRLEAAGIPRLAHVV